MAKLAVLKRKIISVNYLTQEGKGIPDVDNLKMISKILNVSIDFLLDDEEVLDKTIIKEQINLNDYKKEGKLRSKIRGCRTLSFICRWMFDSSNLLDGV